MTGLGHGPDMGDWYANRTAFRKRPLMMVLLIKVTAIERSLPTVIFAGGSLGAISHLQSAAGEAMLARPAAAKAEPNPRLQAEFSFPPASRPKRPGAAQ
jgi:hypothetical protein